MKSRKFLHNAKKSRQPVVSLQIIGSGSLALALNVRSYISIHCKSYLSHPRILVNSSLIFYQSPKIRNTAKKNRNISNTIIKSATMLTNNPYSITCGTNHSKNNPNIISIPTILLIIFFIIFLHPQPSQSLLLLLWQSFLQHAPFYSRIIRPSAMLTVNRRILYVGISLYFLRCFMPVRAVVPSVSNRFHSISLMRMCISFM